MAKLICVLDASAPVTVLRLAGTLSVESAATVRSAMHKVLADAPPAILVDLDETTVADPVALTLFAAFAHTAAGWPGCPLLVCAPSDSVRADLHRMAIDRAVPIYADRSAAIVA